MGGYGLLSKLESVKAEPSRCANYAIIVVDMAHVVVEPLLNGLCKLIVVEQAIGTDGSCTWHFYYT